MVTNNEPDGKIIKIIKYLISFLFVFVLSGIVRYIADWIYQGQLHWMVFVYAGACGLGLALINDGGYRFETDYRIQVTTGAALCTFLEFLVGKVFNSNYAIWDYRELWGTLNIFDDQVNLIFVGLWVIIAAIAIPVLDVVQWQLGIGKKPFYRMGKKYFYPWGEQDE